jgi:hypothetical protein
VVSAVRLVFAVVFTLTPTVFICDHVFVELHPPDFLSILEPVSLSLLSCHASCMLDDEVAVVVREDGALKIYLTR